MSSSILNTITVEVVNGDYQLRASGSTVKFDGFMKIYEYSTDEEEESTYLPDLYEGDTLTKKFIEGKQHFTQPPAKYSEATLVKTLEEYGIGRPSTYSPIISTLLDRKYIERDKKTLIPTELGIIVNNVVSDYFKEIVDVEFTVDIEEKLDRVEEGKDNWNKVVDEFFKPIKESIEIAEKELSKITIEDKISEEKCDKCGRNMVIKHGRFGDFLACPGYPECKNTKPIVEKLDVKCPKCGENILVKKSKKGKKFFGCSGYPNCDYVSWFEPTNEKCDLCGGLMVKRYSKSKGNFLECSNPECKNKKYSDDKQL
jgi:DNA topoisomerase-1